MEVNPSGSTSGLPLWLRLRGTQSLSGVRRVAGLTHQTFWARGPTRHPLPLAASFKKAKFGSPFLDASDIGPWRRTKYALEHRGESRDAFISKIKRHAGDGLTVCQPRHSRKKARLLAPGGQTEAGFTPECPCKGTPAHCHHLRPMVNRQVRRGLVQKIPAQTSESGICRERQAERLFRHSWDLQKKQFRDQRRTSVKIMLEPKCHCLYNQGTQEGCRRHDPDTMRQTTDRARLNICRQHDHIPDHVH